MADSAFVQRTDPGSDFRDVEWIVGSEDNILKESGALVSGNGTTNLGKVKAGTVMGRITSSKKWRPAFATTCITADTSTSKVLTSVENLLVGDDIYFRTSVTNSVVDAIDTGTDTVTLASSIATVASEEVDLNDGSSTALGILYKGKTTAERIDPSDHTVVLHADQPCVIVRRGCAAKSSRLIGATAETKADLAGHLTFIDD